MYIHLIKENTVSVAISKWGNSAGIRLPKNILNTLALNIGDKVNLVQKGHTIIIEPCKLSLEELLEKVTDCNKHEAVFTDKKGHELL
jgi:antitoxin MazE